MMILTAVLVALSTFFAAVAGQTNQTYGVDVVRLLRSGMHASPTVA
jgi:hypothetical protein